jgi:NADPH:quinone reductase-like Zn-dependent oxidoreductase
MNDNKTVTGVNMGHLFDHVEILRPQFEALVRMYEAGQIHPFVDKSFAFDDAPAAHQYLHDRKARGKLLLVP